LNNLFTKKVAYDRKGNPLTSKDLDITESHHGDEDDPFHYNSHSIADSSSIDVFDNPIFLKNFTGDPSELYSGLKLRLNLKIQMLINGESYLLKYIEAYEEKLK
jgi:hypothetical protein